MDVREKLVELLDIIIQPGQKTLGDIADHLISNGVTVQEWISVKDRLPEVGGYVVCIAKRNPFSRFMPMVARIEKNGWVNPITEQYISEVTHWMPMPELPKGGCQMKGATQFDQLCHRVFSANGNGTNYLSRRTGVKCGYCGYELEAYYCESRLYIVECHHCKTKALVMAGNPEEAASKTFGHVMEGGADA